MGKHTGKHTPALRALKTQIIKSTAAWAKEAAKDTATHLKAREKQAAALAKLKDAIKKPSPKAQQLADLAAQVGGCQQEPLRALVAALSGEVLPPPAREARRRPEEVDEEDPSTEEELAMVVVTTPRGKSEVRLFIDGEGMDHSGDTESLTIGAQADGRIRPASEGEIDEFIASLSLNPLQAALHSLVDMA